MIKTIICLCAGSVVAGSLISVWWYLGIIQPQVPSPTINKAFYLLIQTPREWIAYFMTFLFVALIISFISGRLILYKKAYQRASEILPARTRNAFHWYKGKAIEMEGIADQARADRDELASIAQDFHDQLVAIDTVRTSRPRNEIIQRKLLKFAEKEKPLILKYPREKEVSNK